MTATVVDRTPAAATERPRGGLGGWTPVIRAALIGSIVALYLCLVGIVPVFNQRPLVEGVISLGQTSLVLALFGTGFIASRRGGGNSSRRLLTAAVGGGIAGASLSLLVILGSVVEIR